MLAANLPLIHLPHLRARYGARNSRGTLLGGEVHNEFSRFVVFWSGSSLCLVYLMALNVSRGVIRWGEDGATTVARLCIILIYLELVLLLAYMSVLYERDDKDEGGRDGG